MKQTIVYAVVAVCIALGLSSCGKDNPTDEPTNENNGFALAGRTYVQPAQECGCGNSILAFQFRDSTTIAIASGGAGNWPDRQKEAVTLVEAAKDWYTMPTQGGSTQNCLANYEYDKENDRYVIIGKMTWLFPYIYAGGQKGLSYIKISADKKTIQFTNEGVPGVYPTFHYVEPDHSNLTIYK